MNIKSSLSKHISKPLMTEEEMRERGRILWHQLTKDDADRTLFIKIGWLRDWVSVEQAKAIGDAVHGKR